MKKLGKLKLNQFSKDELDRRKMNVLKGGCGCGGGSSSGSCGIYGGLYLSFPSPSRLYAY